MARCGYLLRVGIAALAAGVGHKAWSFTGGGGGHGAGIAMLAAGVLVRVLILGDVVIDVIDRVALFDGDILVAVGDRLRGAVVGGHGIGPVRIIIGPVGDIRGGVSDRVIDGVGRLVDDGGIFDLIRRVVYVVCEVADKRAGAGSLRIVIGHGLQGYDFQLWFRSIEGSTNECQVLKYTIY